MSKVKNGTDRLSSRALSGAASAAIMMTMVNVHTCCWFVLGQDRLPDGAKKLRRF
ncbi:MAG: cyclic lactone autoinducer peptide [Lachnospiraceae bacterium]|nr:cyclic lactone autoinducer peptide [Lachnospiraceae bacterium]